MEGQSKLPAANRHESHTRGRIQWDYTTTGYVEGHPSQTYIYIYICRVGATIRVRVKGVNESLLTLDVITMQ